MAFSAGGDGVRRSLESNCSTVVCNGAIVVALPVVIPAAVVEAHVILGIDPDRLVEVANVTVEIALLPVARCAPGERKATSLVTESKRTRARQVFRKPTRQRE